MSLDLQLKGRADCIGAGLKAEQLARWHGWPEIAAGELKLLVVELCSNAVRYGRGGRCELTLDAERVEVVVQDGGPGFPSWAIEGHAPTLEARGGLGAGLACARRLSNELVLMNLPEGGARAVARRFLGRNTERREAHG